MTSIFPSRESRQGDDDRRRSSVRPSAYFQSTSSSVQTWYLSSFYEYTRAGFDKIIKALKAGEPWQGARVPQFLRDRELGMIKVTSDVADKDKIDTIFDGVTHDIETDFIAWLGGREGLLSGESGRVKRSFNHIYIEAVKLPQEEYHEDVDEEYPDSSMPSSLAPYRFKAPWVMLESLPAHWTLDDIIKPEQIQEINHNSDVLVVPDEEGTELYLGAKTEQLLLDLVDRLNNMTTYKILSDKPFSQIHHLHFENYRDLGSPPYLIDTRYMANIDMSLLVTTILDPEWLSSRGWGDYATMYKSGISARICFWNEKKEAFFSLLGPKITLSSVPSQRLDNRPRQAMKRQNLVWPPIGIEQAVVDQQLAHLTLQTQNIDVQRWLVDVSSTVQPTPIEGTDRDFGNRGRNAPSTSASSNARPNSHVENDQPILIEGFPMQKSLPGHRQRPSPWSSKPLQRPDVQPTMTAKTIAHEKATGIDVADKVSDSGTDLISFSEHDESTNRLGNHLSGSMGKVSGVNKAVGGNAPQKRAVDLLSDQPTDEGSERKTGSPCDAASAQGEIDRDDGTMAISRLPKALRELIEHGQAQARAQDPGIGDSASQVPGPVKKEKAVPKGKNTQDGLEAFRIPIRVKTSLSKLLATGPYLRGVVSLTFDFGRIVLRTMDDTALAFNGENQRSNGWKEKKLEDALNAWFEKPDSMHFTQVLTTTGSDVEAVLKFEYKKKRLWDSSVCSKWRVYSFEIETLDGSCLFVDIEDWGVEDQQRVVIRETENSHNTIWVHDVLRNWDGRFHFKHRDPEEVQAKYGHIATTIYNSFYCSTSSGAATVSIGFALPNDVTIPLRTLRSLAKWQVTSTDGKTALVITETQRVVWKPDSSKNGNPSGWQHFVCLPGSGSPECPQPYYGMSIISPPLERLMAQNMTIATIGGKARWSFEDGQTAVYVQDIWAQATAMLTQMDQIGASNDNGQLEKYKLELPPGNSTSKVDARDPLYGGQPGTRVAQGLGKKPIWDRQYW